MSIIKETLNKPRTLIPAKAEILGIQFDARVHGLY